MQDKQIRLSLPAWLHEAAGSYIDTGDDEQRMHWVLNLALRNIEENTGGPFSAAVFHAGELLAAGVNRVVPEGCSSAHAEVVTLSLAQQTLDMHTLPAGSVLYSSTEPCAMCLGAVCWSGVTRVVTSATGADAESIGFDEGPKPDDWIAALRARNIDVHAELLRTHGQRVLQQYKKNDGEIYNGHERQN